MSKQEFLSQLRKGLSGLPKKDIEERLTFYSEMIDDRMEEGLSESEAVNAIGTVDAIISQISADTSLTKPVKDKSGSPRTLTPLEIVLIILGSPIWLSLGIAAFAVIFSLYISLWAVIISLWAVFASFAACFVGGVAAGIVTVCSGNTLSGTTMLAAGIVFAGLSVFIFYGCKAATKGSLILTKKIAVWIKSCFTKKEVA